LTEPVIIPQVDHVFDDNGSFNIGENMLAVGKLVVKKKEVKKGKKKRLTQKRKWK
jgi:hypothetical protein